jgi:hypothetical protein
LKQSNVAVGFSAKACKKAPIPILELGVFVMDGLYGRLLNWIVLLAGIAGIIYPAFIDDKLSLTQILISLLEPKATIGFAMRWLSVALLIGASYILITSWAYRNLPISVIWTNLDIHFENDDGSRIRFEREQALRANQPGVTAYFMHCRPTAPSGKIPEASIKGSVFCNGMKYRDQIELHGNETRGYEVTHDFGAALPYAWYMPLIPMSLLNSDPEKLSSWLKRNVPVKRMTVVYLNEFNIDRPTMSFTASIYTQHNIRITMHRPPNRIPNLKIRRIKSNGVVDVAWRDQDHSTVIFLDRLQNETLRITWG